MASNPKMEYQVFLCTFQKNSAMVTLGLKEMGKFLWEGREKGLLCWLSKTKLRQVSRLAILNRKDIHIAKFHIKRIG